MDVSRLQYFALVAIALAVMCNGCKSSESVTKYDELVDAYQNQDPIRALTVDSTLYTFENYSITDSTLEGDGRRKRNGSYEPFSGTLNFGEIVFLERLHESSTNALWILPMAISTGFGIADLTKPSNFNITTAGSSCPYIYAYNGRDYVLEAESFSTSISQALESRTFHLLPSLKAVGDELKVRISNERPETQLFNSIHLYAADMKEAASVVLDTQNRLWATNHGSQPVFAKDHSGRDVVQQLSAKDGRYWESDLQNISVGSDFRDKLELEFEIPSGTTDFLLIVDAINTDLITEVYRSVGGILGDEALLFYQALENDPELRRQLEEWVQESSLLVEVFAENRWNEVGSLLPEANVAPFRRALRLKGLDTSSGSLKVRLSSMTDVWRLDAVTADYSEGEPLEMHPLPMARVFASNGEGEDELKSKLLNSDRQYALMYPPEYMDITFDGSVTSGMQRPAYVIAAGGFMYEWFPNTGNFSHTDKPAWMGRMSRVELLKNLIAEKEIFLPPVYKSWSKTDR